MTPAADLPIHLITDAADLATATAAWARVTALAIDTASPVWQEAAAGILKAEDARALEDVIARVGP